MKVQINNYDWEIAVIPGDSEKMNPEPEVYRAGLTEYPEQIISIRQGMSTQRTRATVIHEVIHAFIDSYGYTSDCMTEEEICNFFASQADRIMEIVERILKGVKFDADNG